MRSFIPDMGMLVFGTELISPPVYNVVGLATLAVYPSKLERTKYLGSPKPEAKLLKIRSKLVMLNTSEPLASTENSK